MLVTMRTAVSVVMLRVSFVFMGRMFVCVFSATDFFRMAALWHRSVKTVCRHAAFFVREV